MREVMIVLLCGLIGCGGSTSVDVQNSNEQSQNQGQPTADGEEFNVDAMCFQCIGNTMDGLDDEECLNLHGLTESDC